MVGVVEHDLVAQVLLKMSDETSCEAWMLLELCGVKAPLVLKERLKVLAERCGKALETKPFGECCLENEEVACFAGVKRTVHVGIQENAAVCWECQLI